MSDTATRPGWAQDEADLSDKTVLVVGGSGGVGEGVVRALLASGATVVAVGRSQARLDDLSQRVADARLVTQTLDALDPGLDEHAKQLADRFGPFDGVVVSVASWGGSGRKAALTLTDEEWEDLIASNLTAVFRLYRAFFPHIARSGMMLQLNGMSADIPLPGSAGVAVAAAGRKSLTRTIAAEVGVQGPRVYQLVLGMIRTRPRQLAGIDDPGWIPASDVGLHVADLVAGTSRLSHYDLHYFVDAAIGPQRAAER